MSPGVRVLPRHRLIDDNDSAHASQALIFPVLKGRAPGGIEYSFGPRIGFAPAAPTA